MSVWRLRSRSSDSPCDRTEQVFLWPFQFRVSCVCAYYVVSFASSTHVEHTVLNTVPRRQVLCSTSTTYVKEPRAGVPGPPPGSAAPRAERPKSAHDKFGCAMRGAGLQSRKLPLRKGVSSRKGAGSQGSCFVTWASSGQPSAAAARLRCKRKACGTTRSRRRATARPLRPARSPRRTQSTRPPWSQGRRSFWGTRTRVCSGRGRAARGAGAARLRGVPSHPSPPPNDMTCSS